MADDFTVDTPSGTVTIRAVDLGGGKLAQVLMIAPARKTPVAGAERLSVLTSTVKTLTPPAGATHALLAVEPSGGAIRWYDSGENPSTGDSGNGLQLAAGDYLELDEASLAAFKMIAVNASAVVQVTYWKYA